MLVGLKTMATQLSVSLLDLNNEDTARSPPPLLKAWSSTGYALLPRVSIGMLERPVASFKPHFVTWAKQGILLATSYCLRFLQQSGALRSSHPEIHCAVQENIIP